MNVPTHLWLIRHAPVAGPRGVIHGPDAPADLGDAAGFAALKARLPARRMAVQPGPPHAGDGRRLGLVAAEEPAFREQNFGAWTGRRHDDLERELGAGLSRSGIGRKQPAAGRRELRRPDRARREGLASLARPARRSWSCIPAPSARARGRARTGAGERAALRDRSAVADADRSARARLARDGGEYMCRGGQRSKATCPPFVIGDVERLVGTLRSAHPTRYQPFRRSPRSVGRPMPAASKPPSTARICPVM